MGDDVAGGRGLHADASRSGLPHGGLLGIGTKSGNGGEPRAWWSDDGRTWAAVTPPSGGSLSAIAYDARSEQFAVGGVDRRDRPTIWLTEDGSSWTTVTLDEAPGLVQDVDARDGLIVAVGKLGTMPIPVESDPRVVAWSSYGGLAWEVVELGHHSGLPLTAVAGDTAVTVVDGSGSDDIVRVWSGTAD